MFEALAGSIMAMKVHFAQLKLPFTKKDMIELWLKQFTRTILIKLK